MGKKREGDMGEIGVEEIETDWREKRTKFVQFTNKRDREKLDRLNGHNSRVFSLVG